jgi:prolyl 4-hydroxylase
VTCPFGQVNRRDDDDLSGPAAAPRLSRANRRARARHRHFSGAGRSCNSVGVTAGKRTRSHASFRREAEFHAAPHVLTAEILDSEREAPVRREVIDPACYVLHGLLAPRECKRLIAAAEAIGFTHAGLAVGDDTYRVNLAVRNNLRVVFDAPTLAAGLWQRMRGHTPTHHDGAPIHGLNWRFRVYRYDPGQRFFPHVDVRTRLPGGETRESLVIYLNDEFTGGNTTFYEVKDRGSRRGEGRARKFDNKVQFSLRPEVGAAVVFDHLRLHEGAEVTAGAKYAVRSDMIYAVGRR